MKPTTHKLRPYRNQNDVLRKISQLRVVPNERIHFIGKPIHMENIDNIMSDIKGYIKTFNELKEFPKNSRKKRFGFIILHVSHFRAVYIDIEETFECCYYDSFGKDPEPEIDIRLRELVHNLKSEVYLKYKINRNKMQRQNSVNCGLHVLNFLTDMLVNGKSFKQATNFTVSKAENRARKKGKKYREFGFI